jgi:hypothetical protein
MIRFFRRWILGEEVALMKAVTINPIREVLLTVRQDGDFVEITADTDAVYDVVRLPNRSILELQFAPEKAKGRQGFFSPAED